MSFHAHVPFGFVAGGATVAQYCNVPPATFKVCNGFLARVSGAPSGFRITIGNYDGATWTPHATKDVGPSSDSTVVDFPTFFNDGSQQMGYQITNLGINSTDLVLDIDA